MIVIFDCQRGAGERLRRNSETNCELLRQIKEKAHAHTDRLRGKAPHGGLDIS